MDDKWDMNQPVEITPGVFKRLGDCDRDDLAAAQHLIAVKGARALAAMENLEAGRPPKCDWQGPDGQYCENDADWIRQDPIKEGDDDAKRSLCSQHLPR